MNLLLFPKRQDHYTLAARDPRLEHVRGVLRMGVGDSFDVGVVNGPRGKARIVTADRETISLTVIWEDAPPPPPPALDLLVALPRPATAKKILTEATTLGVRSVHFFASERSDPAYARSRFWTSDGWQEALRLGAEQAFTTYLPPTGLHTDLKDALSQLEPTGARRISPDVYEGNLPLSEIDLTPEDGAILAIGPERGWGPRDRDQLRRTGFTLCTLGQRVLRVETATTVALALLLARLGAL